MLSMLSTRYKYKRTDSTRKCRDQQWQRLGMYGRSITTTSKKERRTHTLN